MNTEEQYPYSGTSAGKCVNKTAAVKTGVTGFTVIKSGDEAAAKEALWRQPILSIGIDASQQSFQVGHSCRPCAGGSRQHTSVLQSNPTTVSSTQHNTKLGVFVSLEALCSSSRISCVILDLSVLFSLNFSASFAASSCFAGSC